VLETATRAPGALRVLVELLRASTRHDVADGILLESLAYSMLLSGPEFRCWRESTPAAPLVEVDEPVLLFRQVGRLEITLNRPGRHNAWGRQVRDGFLSGLELARLDGAITEVVVRGAGPSFCSGGDLDEFGTASDVVSAHRVRLAGSGALAVTALRDRLGAGLRFELHGLCIGAGIEIPAAAARVVADPGTRFRLPELGLGLVPGAGGTVTLPRRIGRWRTAWMALTDAYVDAATALGWGLVDEIG
jgi:enoyl-CoA hydratase/carnithine racemase